MNLPQPQAGAVPNIEILWAGDITSSHLNISLRIGTFFGTTNAFAERVMRECVDCEQLCQCELAEDTGDLMALFHVAPADWIDFAHAMTKKVYRHVASCPDQCGLREQAPGAASGIATHRIN